MSKLTNPLPIPKPVSIAIRVVLIAIAVLTIVWLVLFIIVTTFSAGHYVNANARKKSGYDADYKAYLEANSYEINYPFFGNSFLLSGIESGAGYTMTSWLGPLGEYGQMRLIDAYDKINSVLDSYTWYLSFKYDARVKMNYTVENKDGQLIVHFNGTGYNIDGSVEENIEKDFIFDVKGASMFNPPEWTNHAPEDNYFANWEFMNKMSDA